MEAKLLNQIGTIGYLKSSDINIYDKQSTGMTFTKKNVEEVFLVTKLIDMKTLIFNELEEE